MNNKVTKNLIIFGIIIFALTLTTKVFASYDPYDSSNWLRPVTSDRSDNYYYGNNGSYRQSGYNQSTTYDSNTGRPTVINNYYYQTVPTSTNKTSTTTTQKVATNTSNTSSNKNIATDNTNSSSNNNLGASAYNSRNNITALSLRGSGGFMPSSIWQWILVVILILIIIVISRMLRNRKTTVSLQESHVTHAH